jgi:hypothetical protein
VKQQLNIGARKMNQNLNDYIYSKAGTDITVRWKKMYGYVPASEQAKYIKKWADFREKCAKTLDDIQPEFSKEVVNLRFKQK